MKIELDSEKSLGQVFLNTDWPVNHVAQTMLDWGVNVLLKSVQVERYLQRHFIKGWS